MSRPPLTAADPVAINAVLVASRQAVDAICDRWSLSLVLALLQGERRFGGIATRTGMATRLLSARLKALEADGVLLRRPYSVRPPRHEYQLTAMGEGLLSVIAQMDQWDRAWNASGDCLHLVHCCCGTPLCVSLHCGECGRLTGARDIDLSVSPGGLRAMPPKQSARRRSTVSGVSQTRVAGGLGPSLDVFGDKWSIEILLCAFFRIRRFGDFRTHTGIAANILTDRLERLTAAAVLLKSADPVAPGYRLTAKGRDLYGVIVSIQAWADVWLPDRYRSPVLLIHRACGHEFRPRTLCALCGGVVTHGDLEVSGDQGSA